MTKVFPSTHNSNALKLQHRSVFYKTVCLYVCAEDLDSHWTDFDDNSYLRFSRNMCLEDLRFFKIRQKLRAL